LVPVRRPETVALRPKVIRVGFAAIVSAGDPPGGLFGGLAASAVSGTLHANSAIAKRKARRLTSAYYPGASDSSVPRPDAVRCRAA
jgi:hypothetical protein